MANPNPPYKIPQIVEAKDPSGKFWQLKVRMHSELASKFPDDPWETSIADIGLPAQQSDQYPGYILVDIEAVKGTNELYWIFEKLDGPQWTTITRGVTDLVPKKFKRFIKETQTRQDVFLATQPDAPSGTLVQSIVAQGDDTGKAAKINTDVELILGPPLEGELTDTWGMNTTEEALENEGDPADFGFGVKSSIQSPLGNGLSVRRTENYPDDSDGDGIIYTLEGQEHDSTYGIVIDMDKSLVDASRAKTIATAQRALGKYVELKPLDKWHTIMIAAKVNGLPDPYTWCEYSNFRAPNIIEEAGIVWDSNISTEYNSGGVDDIAIIVGGNLGWSVDASCSISGFVGGVAYSKVRGGAQGNAHVEVTRSFHQGPPVGGCDESDAHTFNPGNGFIWIQAQTYSASKKSWKRGVGFANTGFGGGSSVRADGKLSIHQFGPAEYFPDLALQSKGDPSTVTGVVSAFAGSTPSGGISPGVSLSTTLQGTYNLELSESSEPLQSGQQIIWAVKIYPWRFGIFIKDVYVLTVP